MPKNIVAILLLIFSLTIFSACDLGDLRLIAQFTEISGLASGDRILFRNGYIGDVERIEQTLEGHYLVELDIDSGHKKQLTVYSIFYIDNDPDRPNRKAVITEQKKPGGILLTDNSTVAGLDHPPYLRNMLEDLKKMTEELTAGLADKIDRATDSYEEKSTELTQQLEKSLAEIDRKLQELEEEARTAPDSDQVRELRRNINRLLSDLETTLEQVADTINQELFKSLKESLAELNRRLEKL
jgi:ABC-type transporter Mla subunit MlaD